MSKQVYELTFSEVANACAKYLKLDVSNKLADVEITDEKFTLTIYDRPTKKGSE